MNRNLGVNTNCSCGGTLKETLQYIKAAGFRHIMLSEKTSGEFEGNLRLAREMGFEIPYVHLAYRQPHALPMNDLWVKGAPNRALVDSLIERIKICGKFGVEVAIIHPSWNSSGIENPQWSAAQGIASIKEILKTAEKAGVKIAVENLNPGDLIYLRHLLNNIDSPSLGFCYDCGHHNLYAPKVDFIGEYGSRCFAIHLHDNLMDAPDPNTSERDMHRLPFDGKIDFGKVMRDIAKSSYNGVLMLELNRSSNGAAPLIYERTTQAEFLKEAHSRGKKLGKMLDEARQ